MNVCACVLQYRGGWEVPVVAVGSAGARCQSETRAKQAQGQHLPSWRYEGHLQSGERHQRQQSQQRLSVLGTFCCEYLSYVMHMISATSRPHRQMCICSVESNSR